MKKYIVLILCCLSFSLFSQKYTISGYVKSAENGEVQIGASVYDETSMEGIIANDYGFYSLTLPAGEIKLTAINTGYEPQVIPFSLSKDTTINFALTSFMTEEIVIQADEDVKQRIENRTEMSTVDIPIAQIKKMPALFGEVDVIKAIQLQPGVQNGSEGSSGLYVRGGGADQNLILLDGVPLYYVSHLGGFFSVFNADALSDVKLIKGGFPARYGGRLSSVLDIKMKEGNNKQIEGEGTLGIIASKLSIQGPIGKNKKTSFIISGRRTYLDIFTRPLSSILSQNQTGGNSSLSFGYYFYDLNAKINHTFSQNDRLYFSTYLGNDKLGVTLKDGNSTTPSETKAKIGPQWGNKLAALRWNHIWSPKMFSNLTATYTNYRLSIGLESETQNHFQGNNTTEGIFFKYNSGIRDWGAKLDFDYFPSPRHQVKFGGNLIYHTFSPGGTTFKINAGSSVIQDTVYGGTKTNSLENYVYVEDKWDITDKISVNAGGHFAIYSVNNKNYYSLQPRISTRFLLPKGVALKASYATMTQFLHLLTNADAGLPTDLWVPATENVAPQQSWQAAIGAAKSFMDGQLEFSVEGYYKEMTGLIELKEGATFFGNAQSWEKNVEVGGKGWAYGTEFLLQKKKGKTTGWIGYTLAWNKRQFENINSGNIYPYKYDRRHDMSVVVSHQITDNISVAATWVYGTGNAVSISTASYNSAQNNSYWNPQSGLTLPFFFQANDIALYENGRNGFRMRHYHRLDLGANFTKKKMWKGKHPWERTWNVSAYNAYNRQNPYLYFPSTENYDSQGRPMKKVLKQVSLFPVIPSVSYSFKF